MNIKNNNIYICGSIPGIFGSFASDDIIIVKLPNNGNLTGSYPVSGNPISPIVYSVSSLSNSAAAFVNTASTLANSAGTLANSSVTLANTASTLSYKLVAI